MPIIDTFAFIVLGKRENIMENIIARVHRSFKGFRVQCSIRKIRKESGKIETRAR